MNKITEERYRSLKREVENAKEKADRAQGALDQLMTRLNEEFGCGTVKEAKTLLSKLESKRDRTSTEFEEALKDYEEKWKANK